MIGEQTTWVVYVGLTMNDAAKFPYAEVNCDPDPCTVEILFNFPQKANALQSRFEYLKIRQF
jgi:hypothetical protein